MPGTNDSNIYEYVSSIDAHDKFTYIIMGIFIVILVNRIRPGVYTMVGMLVAALFTYYYNEQSTTALNGYLAEMNQQLESPLLRKAQNLHLDSELVDFLASHREYMNYNPAVYKKLIRQIDNFLQIISDMEKGVDRMGDNFEMAREIKIKILNSFQSMIHRIPNSSHIANDKFHEGLGQLEKLLNYHMNNIYMYMSHHYGKKPIDINTRFFHLNELPGTDTKSNPHYSFF